MGYRITPTNPDTYHGGEPGNCPDCRGTGYNRGDAANDAGSCPHCYGSGSDCHTPGG